MANVGPFLSDHKMNSMLVPFLDVVTKNSIFFTFWIFTM